MTHLIVDRGNSACKWAFFEASSPTAVTNQAPLALFTTESGQVLDQECLQSFSPSLCLYSSVGKKDDGLLDTLRRLLPQVIEYTVDMQIPIVNAYRTPHTLGLDRLAAAVGAWTLAPGRSSLIVDMGTAITYDWLSRDGVYHGGNIAPGIYLRCKVLHQETAALPMVEARPDFPEMGVDTESAIRAGVMQGIWHELEGYRRQYAAIDPDTVTFLTGGDIFYFEKRLESSIFAHSNLVLIGLHRILYDNAFQKL